MGTLSKLCIGNLKSAKGVSEIKTAKSLQENLKQFANKRKGYTPLGPGSRLRLDCAYILINVLFKCNCLGKMYYFSFFIDLNL